MLKTFFDAWRKLLVAVVRDEDEIQCVSVFERCGRKSITLNGSISDRAKWSDNHKRCGWPVEMQPLLLPRSIVPFRRNQRQNQAEDSRTRTWQDGLIDEKYAEEEGTLNQTEEFLGTCGTKYEDDLFIAVK